MEHDTRMPYRVCLWVAKSCAAPYDHHALERVQSTAPVVERNYNATTMVSFLYRCENCALEFQSNNVAKADIDSHQLLTLRIKGAPCHIHSFAVVRPERCVLDRHQHPSRVVLVPITDLDKHHAWLDGYAAGRAAAVSH